jgi:rSAM/selenodomain-associated transferase 1
MLQKQSEIPQNEQLEKENAIIIFIKNPQLGKVKTRLAATVGNEKALEIYMSLMAHTENICHQLDAQKYVYYSDFIDNNDIWSNDVYNKLVQNESNDLGEKMALAFRDTLRENHQKVLIIGSDCLELTEPIINEAFLQLSNNKVVIGPANDGGYYLIGFDFYKIGELCGEVLRQVFLDKQWSHSEVCKEAIDACKSLGLTIAKLPLLTDIDEEKDYLKSIATKL